jgi:hypothetical protein
VARQIGFLREVLAQQTIGFSFVRRCHGLLGVGQVDLDGGVDLQLSVLDTSLPRFQVSERRSWSGAVVIEAAVAPRTTSAP